MVSMFILAISALFAYLLVVPFNFPSFGLSIVFITIASLVLKFKKEIKPFDKIFYLLTILVAAGITLRSSGFLTFLNIIGALYMGSFLVLEDGERKRLNIFQIIILPLRIIARFAQTANRFPFEINTIIKKRRLAPEKTQELIISLLVTLVVLLIVLPLLSSANPLFKKWVGDALHLLNLSKFLSRFFGEDFFLNFLRTMIFLLSFFFLPRILSFVQTEKNDTKEEHHLQLALLLPKVIIGIVLVIFFVSQAQLYFATTQTLKTLNLTHSQYAREVFGQLSIVALVILGLIYTDRSKSRYAKLLTAILLVEGVFLALMALKSVYDYSSTYGFTHKRLYGYTSVFWILGVFAMFAYTYTKQLQSGLLLRAVVIYSAVILVTINLINFDYLICHSSKSRTGQGTDYQYLAFNLSADANCYLNLLESVDRELQTGKREELRLGPLPSLVWKMDNLQHKYKKFDWRAFNYSEFKEYQSIKNINLDKYKKMFEVIMPIPIPVTIQPVNVN